MAKYLGEHFFDAPCSIIHAWPDISSNALLIHLDGWPAVFTDIVPLSLREPKRTEQHNNVTIGKSFYYRVAQKSKPLSRIKLNRIENCQCRLHFSSVL